MAWKVNGLVHCTVRSTDDNSAETSPVKELKRMVDSGGGDLDLGDGDDEVDDGSG